MSAGDQDARQQALAVGLSVLALVVLLVLAGLRGSTERVSGDEGTYLAMAESLAEDLDLEFSEEDEERIANASRPGQKAVILQRTQRNISYSKPFLPAVVMAPFYALFGESGAIVANVFLLAGAFIILWLYLRRFGSAGPASLTLVTFAATGALLPYAAWKTSDALQAALALAGLALCLGSLRGEAESSKDRDVFDRPWAPWIGAAFLGLLIAVRPPNALIAGVVPLALVMSGEWRRLVRFSVAVLLTLTVAAGASWAFFGTVMPYKAERATFNSATGYPAGDDASEVSLQFERGRATSSLDASPDLKLRASAFSTLYFLVGRHTGILVYFPAALFLVISALRRPDRVGIAVLVCVAATAAFFLLWLPFNYFGGGSCIGNRYFLASYAVLPLALRRPLGRWSVAASWTLALLVGGSALASEWAVRDLDRTSQSHAYAGIFRRLPYESTASVLDGSRDHFFSQDFLRTMDPFARVMPRSFRLHGHAPTAEFMMANLDRGDPLRLLVHSSAKSFELTYEDYRQKKAISLSRPMGFRGLVEIQPSPPPRYHPLWFNNPWDHGKPYWTRIFRLGVRTGDGTPVEAEVRFLGKEIFPPQIFARTVVLAELPSSVSAGSVSTLEVRVRNSDQAAWRSHGLFPVYLSYRMEPLDAAARQVQEGARTRLPRVVGPGEVLDARLDVHWPQAAGQYRVRVDLVAEGIAWFERENGSPLAEATVEVVAGNVVDARSDLPQD